MDIRLQDLLIQEILTNKEKSGELEKIISKSIDNMISDICSELLSKDGELYQNAKAKLLNAFSNGINDSDITTVTNKFTKVINDTLPNTSLCMLDTTCNNIYEIFGRKLPDESITLNELFVRYCDFLEKQFYINKSDIYDYDKINSNNRCCVTAVSNTLCLNSTVDVDFSINTSGYMYGSAAMPVKVEFMLTYCNSDTDTDYYTLQVKNKSMYDIATANSYILQLVILENNKIKIAIPKDTTEVEKKYTQNVSCKIFVEA